MASDRRAAEVDHPSYYGGDTTYETIKVLEAWLTPEQASGFRIGNTIKYLSRAGKKGSHLDDLRKAKWYLDREVATAEREHAEVERQRGLVESYLGASPPDRT